jgi:hypothetical protein
VLRSAFILVSLLLVTAPIPAAAHGGNPSQSSDIPAQGLAVQALAMLDAKMGATNARDRVESALRAKNKADVRINRLRSADVALRRNDTALARRELEAAFNPDDRHLIGTSFTSGGDSRSAAGITGIILIVSSLLLVWRLRSRAKSKSHTAGAQAAGG